MHPSFVSRARLALGAVCGALVLGLAGCHNNNNISFYGVAWVTVTADAGGTTPTPTVASNGDYSSYVVTIDSITLTRNDGVVVTALATPEIVDLVKVKDISEFYGTATIPDGTYNSATITLDYTSAAISVLVNGVPTKVTSIVDKSGSTVTTVSETVTFDAGNQLVVSPTYASTSAERFSLTFDLAASGYVDTSGATPTVTVNPYITVGVSPPDTKLVRIRGPLINTNIDIGTYTVYVRPFYDEISNLGSLSLFNTASTVYTINGKSYVGIAGIDQLAQLSAGNTVTAAYTTFTPSVNPLNGAPAGTFYPVYVVAGSTLEDIYTQGISGVVIARNGNTLTLRDANFINTYADTFTYQNLDATVILGAGTLVTADGIATLTGLNSDSIAVGQYIEARGLATQLASTAIQLDATGTSSTNTGSVRIESTQLYGSLAALGAGSLTMNVAAIDGLPASVFNFAGNGATTPAAAAFQVALGALTVPAGTAVGDPLYVNGLATPFGAAPPDFTAYAVNSEASVQVAAGAQSAAGTQTCGVGSQVCEPASLRVIYSYATGTATPFAGLSNSGFSIDLANSALLSAVIRIGPQSIDLKSLPASPEIVPTSLPITTTFSPQYAVGNPATASVTPTVTTATSSIQVATNFPGFVSNFNTAVSATNAVLQVTARGVYDRATNTFTATSINVVL